MNILLWWSWTFGPIRLVKQVGETVVDQKPREGRRPELYVVRMLELGALSAHAAPRCIGRSLTLGDRVHLFTQGSGFVGRDELLDQQIAVVFIETALFG